MNHQESVSIIVPCFNSGLTLNKAIESLVNQDWTNKEIIIVDDGSTDIHTLNQILKVKKYPYVKLITQKNKGLANARNTGIRKATGSYVVFLDSDDWLDSNAISSMVKAFKSSKEAAVIFSDIKLTGENIKLKKTFSNGFEQLFSNQLPYCMFFPKFLFEQYGGYDENLKLGLEDWDLNIRLILGKQKFLKLSEPVFNYNISNLGMLKSQTMKSYVYIWRYIRNKYNYSYSLRSLYQLYRTNMHQPANRSLKIYFFYWLVLSFVPQRPGNALIYYLSKYRNIFLSNKSSKK